jgi:hypothetical protein
MKLIKLFAIIAVSFSASAFAQTAPLSCFNIATFPTVQKTIDGKLYNFPKCTLACPNVTPYTRPRCVDYDHVFPSRALPGTPKPVVPPVVAP